MLVILGDQGLESCIRLGNRQKLVQAGAHVARLLRPDDRLRVAARMVDQHQHAGAVGGRGNLLGEQSRFVPEGHGRIEVETREGAGMPRRQPEQSAQQIRRRDHAADLARGVDHRQAVQVARDQRPRSLFQGSVRIGRDRRRAHVLAHMLLPVELDQIHQRHHAEHLTCCVEHGRARDPKRDQARQGLLDLIIHPEREALVVHHVPHGLRHGREIGTATKGAMDPRPDLPWTLPNRGVLKRYRARVKFRKPRSHRRRGQFVALSRSGTPTSRSNPLAWWLHRSKP